MMNLIKLRILEKIFCIQYLREKSQLELRVVCATHRGKRAGKAAWNVGFSFNPCRPEPTAPYGRPPHKTHAKL